MSGVVGDFHGYAEVREVSCDEANKLFAEGWELAGHHAPPSGKPWGIVYVVGRERGRESHDA